MELRKITKLKKKAQFESILLVVIFAIIMGVIVFFFNHVNQQLYESLDEYFEEDPKYNDTIAPTTEKLRTFEESRIWDNVVLAVYIGLLIQMLIFSFATRVSPVFFWLFVLSGIIIVITGAMLSNFWQEIVNQPQFAETLTRFPVTNALLGSYYPIAITAVLFLAMIILFGKPPGGPQQ